MAISVGIRVECVAASGGAEVEGRSVVLPCRGCGLRVDGHTADRIDDRRRVGAGVSLCVMGFSSVSSATGVAAGLGVDRPRPVLERRLENYYQPSY